MQISNAQCTPDLTLTIPGVYPDSATGLATGTVGVSYNQVIQVRTFLDSVASITIGSNTITTNFRLDSIMVNSITGIPPGLTYACNPSTCKFIALSNGCILLSGTPTTAGVYPVTVNVVAKGKLTQLGNIAYSQPFSITYYTITIDTNSGIIELLPKDKLSMSQNIPNPIRGKSTVYVNTPKAAKLELKVYNILGKEVYSTNINARRGVTTITLDSENFSTGLYMYSVSDGTTSITRRMVVSK
jgi:hypothetical protein